MDKEIQDKLWKGLSEETKQEYREKYKFHLADSKRDPKDYFGGGYDLTVLRSETIVKELITMFGEHNLNPKPIKKEGWIVIYSCGDPIAGRVIYKTKEEARKDAVGPNNPQIVKIEWEE